MAAGARARPARQDRGGRRRNRVRRVSRLSVRRREAADNPAVRVILERREKFPTRSVSRCSGMAICAGNPVTASWHVRCPSDWRS